MKVELSRTRICFLFYFLGSQKNSSALQRGTALVEVFVLILVMIPLGLILPMIGKLIDARQTTELASRYLAWEKTVSPVLTGLPSSYEQKQQRLHERFFNNPGSLITSKSLEAGSSANPLWGDFAQTWHTADRLQLSSQGVGLESQAVGLPQSAAAVSSGIKKGGEILDFLSSVDWDISGNGMSLEEVRVQMDIGHLLGDISNTCSTESQQSLSPGQGGSTGDTSSKVGGRVCFSSGNAILTDGWNSGSNLKAEKRSRAMVPAAALEKVGYALSLFGNIPVAKELKGLQHSFGYIDSTQLPLDRYED